jgi:hypothetical protein
MKVSVGNLPCRPPSLRYCNCATSVLYLQWIGQIICCNVSCVNAHSILSAVSSPMLTILDTFVSQTGRK